MAIIKEILIDDKKIKFKASASIPRLYRNKFRRDIYKDLILLDKASKNKKEISIDNLELFENIAYIMAYHADNKIPSSVDEWLEEFSTFSVYKILPELIKLWGLNINTMSIPKKKQKKQSVK